MTLYNPTEKKANRMRAIVEIDADTLALVSIIPLGETLEQNDHLCDVIQGKFNAISGDLT